MYYLKKKAIIGKKFASFFKDYFKYIILNKLWENVGFLIF